MEGDYNSRLNKMQKEEYLIKNACYSVTKYYLCKRNNKRSLLSRKQRSQVARSFPNRYLFSYTNKVTSLFSTGCVLRIILVYFSCHFRHASLINEMFIYRELMKNIKMIAGQNRLYSLNRF